MSEIKLKPEMFRIFYRLYQGKTVKEIAKELNFSYHTIKNLKTKMFSDLNIKNRFQIPDLVKNYKITLDFLIE